MIEPLISVGENISFNTRPNQQRRRPLKLAGVWRAGDGPVRLVLEALEARAVVDHRAPGRYRWLPGIK